MIIRRLSPADAAAYRRLRLRGLRSNPEAFGSSYGEEAKRPVKAFARRLERTRATWTFGAFEGRRLVGVLSLIRAERRKERHKAEIVGMYVDPAVRRKGIGRALLRRAVETAHTLAGLRRVRIAVVEANRPALGLYESAGFRVYAREEDALLVRGRLYSMLFLVRTLPGRGRSIRRIGRLVVPRRPRVGRCAGAGC
jgi:RimJ/RimL family protein N-acetyltransferase